MAALITRLAPTRRRASGNDAFGFDDWLGMFGLGGLAGVLQTTMHREQEAADGSFESLVINAYMRNSVVFACLAVRARLFGQARFVFQQMRGNRPGNLFGTPALSLIEKPEPGKRTTDLLQGQILDADLGGNGFLLGRRDAIRRLRPDWTVIAYGSRKPGSELGSWDPDAEAIGYGYWPGGMGSGEAAQVFLPNEISHFAPTKDPLARNRGVSLLTAGLREILADNGATTHKLAFFNNAATPNLALKFPAGMKRETAQEWIDIFEQEHKGATKAFKTIYLGSGVEPTAVGLNFQDMDYAKIQGKAETRIAALTGMHPVVAALSEGLSGSSLNAGNFGSARRLVGDATLRPLWGDFAGSLETIVPPPVASTRLWYDERDIPFLREDVADQADIIQLNATTIGDLITSGFTPASAVDSVVTGDMTRLVHTGLTSVQLQPPLAAPAAYRVSRDFWAVDQPFSLLGNLAAGTELAPEHPLVAAFPSLFEPVVSAPKVVGPGLIVTREQVRAVRDRLAAEGKPHGRESIARELGVSADTVRRRLEGE